MGDRRALQVCSAIRLHNEKVRTLRPKLWEISTLPCRCLALLSISMRDSGFQLADSCHSIAQADAGHGLPCARLCCNRHIGLSQLFALLSTMVWMSCGKHRHSSGPVLYNIGACKEWLSASGGYLLGQMHACSCIWHQLEVPDALQSLRMPE